MEIDSSSLLPDTAPAQQNQDPQATSVQNLQPVQSNVLQSQPLTSDQTLKVVTQVDGSTQTPKPHSYTSLIFSVITVALVLTALGLWLYNGRANREISDA